MSRSAGAEICAHAGVAQLVEHRFCKPKVRGSSPLPSSRSFAKDPKKTLVGCPSGQREQAVNLPASAYEGSNPSPTTAKSYRDVSGSFLGVSVEVSNLVVLEVKMAAGVRRGTTPTFAGVTQLVECQPSKLNVAGSNPVSRSAQKRNPARKRNSALIAQVVERVLGKDEVTSSNLVEGSSRFLTP